MRTFFTSFFKLLNILIAIASLLAIVSFLLPITQLSSLSLFGLIWPVLGILHLLFVLFWGSSRNRFAFLSVVCLLVSILVFDRPFSFSFQQKEGIEEGEFSIMSYNVRNLNKNQEIPIAHTDSAIFKFLHREKPDVLCVQESHYAMKRKGSLDLIYPYKYVDFIYGNYDGHVINSIYSKFPIVNYEVINFPKSDNAAICADLMIQQDTIRVYNVHLQSFRVIPDMTTLQDEKSGRLIRRMLRGLEKQEEQVKVLQEHMAVSNLPVLLAGDLNNIQFSKVYRQLGAGLQDSFLKSGSGWGKTIQFFGLPLRIDYIFADNHFEVLSHKNFDIELSDHYPIMARVKLTGEGVK